MDNRERHQTTRNNFNQKRLGWVPDHPDLRDYTLDNEDKLTIKIEGRTEELEKLAEYLIKLVSDFPQESNANINNLKQNLIDEIESNILGGFLFRKVKLHKILRSREVFRDKEINAKYPPNLIEYESIFSKQIIDLKKYLGVLLIKKKLSQTNADSNTLDIEKISEVVNWMKQEEYDYITKSLVKDFQCRSHIKADGIVGLETYTTLHEYFSDDKKISLLERNNIESNQQAKFPRKIKFVSITSLILNVGIERTLNILIDKVCEKYPGENIQNILKKFQNTYETSFLTEVGIEEEVDKIYLKEILEDFWKEFLPKEPEDDFIAVDNLNEIIKNILNAKNERGNHKLNNYLPQFSDIVEVLQKSYLIEPIISVIIQNLSPLARWRNQNFEDLIDKGFQVFENIVTPNNKSHDTNPEPGYSKNELAKDAISKVLYLIQEEISSIIDYANFVRALYIYTFHAFVNFNKNDINKFSYVLHIEIHKLLVLDKHRIDMTRKKHINTIFVCFLLNEYLNNLKQDALEKVEARSIYVTKKPCDQSKAKIEEPKPNIFDKQEVFEIEPIVINDGKLSSLKSNNKENAELFATLNLHIPITNNNLLKSLKIFNKQKNKHKKLFFLLPSVIDLSFWCSPVKDQGSLNSCTAFAAIALLEYFENRSFGKSTDASPLFLYKAARNKMNVQGDVGSSIRETMKVLALFGVPPEESWPYEEDKADEEPPPYCYAYAQNYKTLKYFLLDYAGITTESLLFQIKAVLAAGFPCIFGLTVYTSTYENTNYRKGHIPYPDPKKDKVVGGHTAVVVGYDDYKFIQCADRKHYSRGAFLVRNSWGTRWGVNGYGWLPYDYVLAGLTSAWWSLLKAEWFDENNFGLAGTAGEGPQGKP